MGKNLNYQFYNAIKSAFGTDGKGGFDKHSMRSSGVDTNDKIFSWKGYKNLNDMAKNFSGFMKENYPDVKLVKDIKPEHAQHFLNSKANTCSRYTIDVYKSNLKKLDAVCSARYGTKKQSFMVDVKTPVTAVTGSIRKNVSVTQEDWAKIKVAMEGSNSKANIIIELCKEYGLRVESATNMRVKDFDFDRRIISVVDDKGGRDRTIPMTNIDICKKVCGTKGLNDRITKLRPGSVNKQFQRLALKAGVGERYRQSKTSIHALRKMASIDLAIKLKDIGFNREQVLTKVSVWLGHGVSRRDVLTKYLDNATIEYISRV